jgi:hypothetical protein
MQGWFYLSEPPIPASPSGINIRKIIVG